jgi:hypothetical protein
LYKNYTSQSSLYNNKKRFHQSIEKSKKVKVKIFSCKQSKYEHIKNKVCNNTNIILYDNELDELKNKIIEFENKISNNNIITNNTNNGTINNTINNIIKVSFGAVCIYFAKQNIFMTTRFKIKINKFLF